MTKARKMASSVAIAITIGRENLRMVMSSVTADLLFGNPLDGIALPGIQRDICSGSRLAGFRPRLAEIYERLADSEIGTAAAPLPRRARRYSVGVRPVCALNAR